MVLVVGGLSEATKPHFFIFKDFTFGTTFEKKIESPESLLEKGGLRVSQN